MGKNKTGQYLKYAIGEIVLVVIGILIAISINNWNEKNKANANEIYILTEILKNLKEDALLVEDIIQQREKAKGSFYILNKFANNEEVNIDTLQLNLVYLLTFERYFPINNAYEVLKSKGLKLTNNNLTTSISRYYDYEQNKINSSIKDIEFVVLQIYNNPKSFFRFISSLKKDESIVIKNYNNPDFKKELSYFLVPFEDNNGGTLDKLLAFRINNQKLNTQIEHELKSIQ